jgi:hypothetical protein
MATKQKIQSAQDTVSKAQNVLDAADSSLAAAEKATDAAEKAKSKSGLLVTLLALLTLIGIVYLVNRDKAT